jgi:hypothetical protein
VTAALFVGPRSPILCKTTFNFMNNAWMQGSFGRNLIINHDVHRFFLWRGTWQQSCFIDKPLYPLINLSWRLIHWLVSCICPSCISTIPIFISHFSHGHFTLAQTIETFRFRQALIPLGLGWKLAKKQESDPRKLKSLNSSSSTKEV